MKRTAVLSLCLWSWVAVALHAQPIESLKPSKYNFQLTHILKKDGTLKIGWFLGTYGDTLLAQIGGKSERISRRDLLRVDIEGKRETASPTLVGMLMGIYAGNALILKAENQPFLFLRRSEGFGGPLIYGALGGLLGGGIGYLVGIAQNHDVTFDFTGNEEENASSWNSLADNSSEGRRKGSVHFCLQGAWVSGPLPHPDQGNYQFYYYGGEAALSLNMMRKLQLTYSLTEFVEVGLATIWLGQPSVSYYNPNSYASNTVSLEGRGYYAVGVFQPLSKLGLRNVQWDIGAGVGTASVDFKAASPPVYFTYDSVSSGTLAAKTKTTFSAMIYTELKVFVADYFSLGITADWVHIPEKAPEIKDVILDSKTLGTTSIGFVLGFHL